MKEGKSVESDAGDLRIECADADDDENEGDADGDVGVAATV